MTRTTMFAALCVALVACQPSTPDAEVASDSAPVNEAPAALPDPVAAETANTGTESAGGEDGFSRTLELQGIRFDVQARDGTLTVTPSGLEATNEPMVSQIAGAVRDAEVADIDGNGSPEVYVFIEPMDAGGSAGLVAYASNNRKSLSAIYLPPLESDPALSEGYAGGSELAVVENRVALRYPIVGPQGEVTGKTRQVSYRLAPGEAGWVLEKADVNEF